MIYFDNAATTYPKPESVYKALDYANRHLAFNAGRGTYKESTNAKLILDKTRESIASFAGFCKEDVAFLSSATESLNLIILGLDLKDNDCVYITPFEHNAIIRPLFNLQKSIEFKIRILPFDKETREPNLDKMKYMFSMEKPKAIFVSHVSNVTGLLINYTEIFKIAKKFDSFTILDSAQAFGVITPNLEFVDFCVFAGHKSLYASFGIAGIISKKLHLLKIVKSGGNGSDSLNHEMPLKGYSRIESGSSNVVAAYGLLESIKRLKSVNIFDSERKLTKYLVKRLKQLPNVIIYLPKDFDSKIFGIVSINVPGYTSDDVASTLYDEFKIAVRSGYHCSPFVHNFISSEDFKGTVRISLGAFNTCEEIDKLVDALSSF